MDFILFKQKVKDGLQEFLGEEVGVETSSITKNNGVTLEGISIFGKGSNVSPTIYLNDFYTEFKKGKALSSIVYQIAKTYDETKLDKDINMSFFLDYKQVKGKIIYKLINYEKNRMQLEKVPHIPFLDLAIIFQCMMMNDRIGSATIMITNKHCEMWKVSKKELLEIAEINTPKYLKGSITSMDDVIQNILKENLRKEMKHKEEEEESSDFKVSEEWIDEMTRQMLTGMKGEKKETDMYVLTNGFKINGAACILYPEILQEFSRKQQGSFFILPSSVHEVILIPDRGGIEVAQLQEMVYDVNNTQVEDEEILSDTVYYYDWEKEVVEPAK